MAAVTVVLALVIITTFMKVIESSDEPVATRSTTTTVTTLPGDTTTTSLAPIVTSTTDGVVTPAICSEPEPPSENATVLQVYFACGSNDLATGGTFVYRAVAPTDLVLTTTLREMANGLEPEEAALGYKTPLPETARGSFLGVSIDKIESKAFLEFNTTVFPDGVDTPEGSQIFLSVLNANVFQFGTIEEVEYRLGGSCDAFWQQLGSTCQTVTRAQWQAQLTSG